MDIAFHDILHGAGTAPDRFSCCLDRCRDFLKSASPSKLYADWFADPDDRRVMANVTVEATHIGFIVPPSLLSIRDMNRVAERAGYGPEFNSYRSAIVAHELGTLSGGAPVPTRIQAFGLAGSASPAAHVEVFIPDADAEALADWIEVDACTHVGFSLSDASMLLEIGGVFRRAGYEIPRFMDGRPMINDQAGIGVVYFDAPGPLPRRRIEFLLSNVPAA